MRTSELKVNTTVRSFPGATINSLKSRLSGYDLDECKTIILHIGTNDADNGSDIETFAENFETLITDLMKNDRQVIVSGLLPRKGVDISPYNDRLKLLCEAYEMEYVDNYKGFLMASGEIPGSYFQRDKTHLNSFGLRKLLSDLNRVHHITRPHQESAPRNNINDQRPGISPRSHYRNGPHSGYRHGAGGRTYRHGNHFTSKFCHICSIDGHETRECWFNGRNNGWSERNNR